MPLLQVKNLKKFFEVRQGFFKRVVGHVQAVNNVSFYINDQETLGLVGESGCGKTTAGRCILRLIEPTSGQVLFNNKDFLQLKKQELIDARKDIQVIFQDPYSSLNPRKTVLNIIGKALRIHKKISREEQEERVVSLLREVGLVADYINKYPHEFSGGQRQRIGIARALALGPKLIICDEAVSALDVSIQSQVINLLQKLQEEHKLSYLFIAHDLSVVKHISDRIAVMYLGKIVETCESRELFANPKHPYTQSLLSAIPIASTKVKQKRIILKGDVPSPIDPPSGCNFHTRCPKVMDICKQKEPEKIMINDTHMVKCFLYNK